MTRCCLCGRFMDDDQVLLGFSRDLDRGGQEYAHAECGPNPLRTKDDGRKRAGVSANEESATPKETSEHRPLPDSPGEV